MGAERRQHNRAEVDWHARIGARGLGVFPARVKDASIGGVYLLTTLAVAEGDNVLVELPIPVPGGEKLVLTHGKVSRKVTVQDDKLFGYGVQFLKLDDDVLMHLLSVCAEG